MKNFATKYPDFPFLQVPLAQLREMPILQARLTNFTVSTDGEFVQVPLAQITWYHHIMAKVKQERDIEEQLFVSTYILQLPDKSTLEKFLLDEMENHHEKPS